jgi:A1 cistron-splicing factor AAR2
VEPLQKKISSVAELVSLEVVQTECPVKEKRLKRLNYEDQLLPQMQPKPGTELNFTKVPTSSFPEGSSATDITRYSIDTSYILEQMLSTWER